MDYHINFIERGGVIMYPLLLCSLISLTIIIERALFWWRIRKNKDYALAEAILVSVDRGDFEQAMKSGEETGCYLGKVLICGIAHREYSLINALEVATAGVIVKMRRYLPILDTIITLAPLLGILGTVLGIIVSFDLLGVSGIEDPKAVTGGIAQALITTATGLTVALFTLVPYNYFESRTCQAIDQLEQYCSRLEIAYQKVIQNNIIPPTIHE